MPFYFAIHTDLVLSLLSCVLVLAGAVCLSASAGKATGRPVPSWRYLGVALFILAAREWVGILALGAPEFVPWYTVGSLLQAAAALCALLAARVESLASATRPRFVPVMAAALVACVLGTLIEPYFRQSGLSRHDISAMGVFLFYATRFLLFLSAAALLHCAVKSPSPPDGRQTLVLAVFLIKTLLIAVSFPPAVPAMTGGGPALPASAMTLLYLARLAATAIMAGLTWDISSRIAGIARPLRWWPLAILLAFLGLVTAILLIASGNYEGLVKRNLSAMAANAALDVTLDTVEKAVGDREPPTPKELDRIFGTVRRHRAYRGYGALRVHADVLLAPVGDPDAAFPVVDTLNHPEPGLWSGLPNPALENRAAVLAAPAIFDRGVGDLLPVLATAPLPAERDGPRGAVVLSVPAEDIVLDMYLHKRHTLLFLPVAFFLLLLLFLRQQHAWMASNSYTRITAMRPDLHGNELAGAMTVLDHVIVDCNRRMLDIVGLARDRLIGSDVREVFGVSDPGAARTAGTLRPGGGPEEAATFELPFRRGDGKALHLLVFCRHLTGRPEDALFIWEAVDITRNKAEEERLRNSRDDVLAIFQSLPGPVFLKDSRGRYAKVNRAFVELFEAASEQQFVGRTTRELDAEMGRDAEIHDEICRDMNGGALVYDMTAVTFGGVSKRVEVAKTLHRARGGEGEGAIVGTIHNVDERQRAHDSVDAERAFLVRLVDALPLAICFVDRAGVIRFCNRDFCREVGVEEAGELLGRRYGEIALFDPAVTDAGFSGGGYSTAEFEVVENGRRRNVRIRRMGLSGSDGRMAGTVNAFLDTTDLAASDLAAQRARQTRTALLVGMAHELRTPMNGIIGMSDLIIDHAAPPVLRLYAETAIKSAKALQMAMDDMVDVIISLDDESRSPAVASAPFPLLALVEETTQIAGCIVEALGVELFLSYDFGLRFMYTGDSRRLRQVVAQILANCARLTADKRLRLDVAGEKDGMVAFSAVFSPREGVTSESVGEEFRRAGDCAGHSPPAETGVVAADRMGLPLVGRLIREMGGTLRVDADAGLIRCAVLVPLAPRTGDLDRVPAPDLAGLDVLVATADDERFAVVEDCLDYALARTVRVESAEALLRALARVRKGEERPELVVIDAAMTDRPRLISLLRELEAGEAYGNPGVILVTTPERIQWASELGGNIRHLLLPPVCPDDIWYQAEAMLRKPDAENGGTDAKSSTTVILRRRSARVTRMAKIPANVLLVEDNMVNQMVAMGILKRIGCNVTLAKNGREAVDAIAAGGVFDLILMDCLMPEMDGYEATGLIRLHEKASRPGTRTMIVALTANALPGEKEKCLAAGMDDYLTKPVTLDSLRAAVAGYCPHLVMEIDPASSAPQGG